MSTPTGDFGEPWDEEVELRVLVRVTAKPDPEFYEGLLGRSAASLAQAAVNAASLRKPEILDGYADLVGDVDIIDVDVDHRPATPDTHPGTPECANGHPLLRTGFSAGHPVYWCERCRVSGYGVPAET